MKFNFVRCGATNAVDFPESARPLQRRQSLILLDSFTVRCALGSPSPTSSAESTTSRARRSDVRHRPEPPHVLDRPSTALTASPAPRRLSETLPRLRRPAAARRTRSARGARAEPRRLRMLPRFWSCGAQRSPPLRLAPPPLSSPSALAALVALALCWVARRGPRSLATSPRGREAGSPPSSTTLSLQLVVSPRVATRGDLGAALPPRRRRPAPSSAARQFGRGRDRPERWPPRSSCWCAFPFFSDVRPTH